MNETQDFFTNDQHLFTVNTKYITESELIQELIQLNSNEPIKLNINLEHFTLIYSYMQHDYLNPVNIENIEKPAMKLVSEYLGDDWYNTFLSENLKDCQALYNVADYLGMSKLSKIIVAHIGYYLNNSEDRTVKDKIVLPENVIKKQIYDIDKHTFVYMDQKELSNYLKNQSKKWNICINSFEEINNNNL